MITELDDRTPAPHHLKPSGFWVSVESDDEDSYGWSNWCLDNDFDVAKLANVHEVTLAAGANILRINTAEELRTFTRAWDLPTYRPPKLGERINWQGVAELYQGILITPYLWSERLSNEAFWYYGWDCASGCIWDLAAIESIRLVVKQESIR
jgi:hypothetical protein